MCVYFRWVLLFIHTTKRKRWKRRAYRGEIQRVVVIVYRVEKEVRK